MTKKSNSKKKSTPEVPFTYEKDTKRMHRFSIGAYGEDFSGTFYMPKGAKIPDQILLVKAQTDDDDEED